MHDHLSRFDKGSFFKIRDEVWILILSQLFMSNNKDNSIT